VHELFNEKFEDKGLCLPFGLVLIHIVFGRHVNLG